MARIAIAHVDLSAKGGGEAVSLNVVEALQDDHDLTLLTLAEPDVPALNDYFETAVRADDLDVRRPPGALDALRRLEGRLGVTLYNLRNALLNRFVARHAGDFDLVVGTDNELSIPGPLVQYVHTPRFARLVVSERVGEDRFRDHAYDRLAYRLGGYDAAEIRDSRLLANSSWMAGVVQDAYGERPDVVNPPVDTRGFDGRPWEERECGFVTVGRLARYKNVEDAIRIVDGVGERGHDVHLHVVGPAYDESYAREIEAMADGRPYVELEGELPREELVDLVGRHRYGLHAKRHEHFGMAVAEFVAGGAVPFVPGDGGQREIVDGRDAQLYHTVEEAVETIDRVLSDRGLQDELRTDPGEVERRYGRERFQAEIREVVDDELDARGRAGDGSSRNSSSRRSQPSSRRYTARKSPPRRSPDRLRGVTLRSSSPYDRLDGA